MSQTSPTLAYCRVIVENNGEFVFRTSRLAPKKVEAVTMAITAGFSFGEPSEQSGYVVKVLGVDHAGVGRILTDDEIQACSADEQPSAPSENYGGADD